MADITKTIDPDDVGADYASIAAWDAGEQTDLVTDTNTHTVTLSNISDSADNSAAVNLTSAWTVSATYYLKITVNPSYRHDGTRGTGYRYIPSTSYVSTLQLQDECILDGLAVSSSSANSYQGIRATSADNVKITNCLVYDIGTDGFAVAEGIVVNCIAIGSGSEGFFLGSAAGVYAANCTSIANNQGFETSDWSTVTYKNCYAGGNTNQDFTESANSTTNAYNCMASDTSFATESFNVESNCTDSVTYNTSNLTNVTAGSEDPKLPAGSSLIDAGIDIDGDAEWPTECESAGDGTDFQGTVRGATWDVGADEIVDVSIGNAGIMTPNTGYWGPTF